MNRYEILFVDDDKAILKMVSRYLTREGYSVSLADSGRMALDMLEKKKYDIVFTDFRMPEMDGIELLTAIKKSSPETEVVVVTGHGTMETAFEAMKIGSYDYLQKPFKLDLLKLIIDRITEEKRLKGERALLKSRIKERHAYDALIGISLGMQEIYETIDHMKSGSPNVLIRGESGTGKELAARVIHRTGNRSHRPLTTVTGRNFPSGAPAQETAARLTQLLEAAAGGTLYFDEIATISLSAQDDILQRTRADGTAGESASGNVRLIAATNRDLGDAVEGGLVHRDFLNLVDGVTLRMPPLRERKEDICLLVNYFLHRSNAGRTRKIYAVTPEASAYLLRYHWPGNVIQLENVIERAFALGVETVIDVADLPTEIKTFGDLSKGV